MVSISPSIGKDPWFIFLDNCIKIQRTCFVIGCVLAQQPVKKNLFFNRWGETTESAVPALKPHSLFLSAFQNLQVVQINLETERMNSSRGNILLLCPKLLAHMNSILLHFGSNHAVVFPRVKLRRSRTRCPRERIQAEAFFFLSQIIGSFDLHFSA